MKNKEYIYRVAFVHPPVEGDSSTAFYFGSLAAVYEMFSPGVLGVALKTLWKKKVCQGVPYNGKYVSITREPFYRKANIVSRS